MHWSPSSQGGPPEAHAIGRVVVDVLVVDEVVPRVLLDDDDVVVLALDVVVVGPMVVVVVDVLPPAATQALTLGVVSRCVRP